MDILEEPRGFRNNNPGNIEWGDDWVGLSKNRTDNRFCQFISVEYGIRAIFKILDTYRKKYGLTTITQIINRWAPPSENDTGSYIKSVCQSCAIGPDEVLDQEALPKVVRAIIRHENGINLFSLTFIEGCRDI